MKKVKVICLKLKISITTEMIEFTFRKASHRPWVILGYFVFRFKPWDGFRLYPFEDRVLDTKGASASLS